MWTSYSNNLLLRGTSTTYAIIGNNFNNLNLKWGLKDQYCSGQSSSSLPELEVYSNHTICTETVKTSSSDFGLQVACHRKWLLSHCMLGLRRSTQRKKKYCQDRYNHSPNTFSFNTTKLLLDRDGPYMATHHKLWYLGCMSCGVEYIARPHLQINDTVAEDSGIPTLQLS